MNVTGVQTCALPISDVQLSAIAGLFDEWGVTGRQTWGRKGGRHDSLLLVPPYHQIDQPSSGAIHVRLGLYRLAYLASRQLSPIPISTIRGTENSLTLSISCFTRVETASSSSDGHPKTSSSCTCSSMALRWPAACSAASIRTIASFIKSAAVPWRGVLTAVRSANPRELGLRLLMSGMGRSRPNSVR